MDKKIEDYLHLYLGCECMVVNHFKSTVIGIHTNGNIQVAHAKSNQTFWEAKYIKPLLRKLSDMSEEEEFEWSENGHKEADPMMAEAEATRYLLSKYFDLFGLIEAGLALDKTNQ